MKAPKRDRVVVGFVALVLAVFYVVHAFGYALFPTSVSQMFVSESVQSEAQQMRLDTYYSRFSEAYLSFMVGIEAQSALSGVLIVLLLSRRVLTRLKVLRTQELERFGWFLLLVFAFGIVLSMWLPEGASIIFNENRRLGGLPFWLSTLLLAFSNLFFLTAFLAMYLFPAVLNHNIDDGTS